MTISSLLSALTQGYNASQIVGWLSNNHKKLGKTIKSALAQGYTQDDILEYLTKGKYASHGQRNEMLSGQTEKEKGSRIFNQGTDWKGLAKNVGTGVALASGLYGAARGLPAISQGLQSLRGAPPPPPPGPTPMGNPPTSPSPGLSPLGGGSPLAPQTQPQLPQVQNISKPSPSLSPVRSVQIINDLGIGPQIKSLQQAGNPPEGIAAAIGISLKPGQRKWLDEQIKAGSAKPLADMIQDYMSEPGQRIDSKQTLDQVTPEAKEFIKGQMDQGQEGTLPEMLDKFGKQKKESPLMEQMGEDVSSMQEKIGKGHLVATPSGQIGEVKEIRNGKALIEKDGKLHQVPEEDLVASPLPEKDLADLYDDLIGGIEKETGEEVSRNVNIAGYNPETNRLLYQPHAGGVYIYGEIPQDDADLLKKFLSTRKTTGQNFIGAWKEGTKSPIGAAMSALIKRLQSERGGKGKEYEEKFDIIYDALRPAIEAKRKKARKKK